MWPVGTLEYLRVRVTASVNGNASYNPTGDVVQFGFVAQGGGNTPSTAPGTWLTGSWETDTLTGQTAYVAKCLVGPSPGVFTPTANTTYFVWLRITDSPEAPVRQVGTLAVT